MNLNKVKAVLASIAVASSLLLPITYNSNKTYKAAEPSGSTPTEQQTPYAYMLLGANVDATGTDFSNGVWHFSVGKENPPKWVWETKEKSILANKSQWQTPYNNNGLLKLPKKVGQYEVEGYDLVAPYTINKPLGFLNKQSIPGDYLTSSEVANSINHPLTSGPFCANGKPAIIITGSNSDGTAYTAGLDSSVRTMDKFNYRASSYTVERGSYNEQTRQLNLTFHTNWIAESANDSDNGDEWTNAKNFSQMMNDAKDIVKQCKKNGLIPADKASNVKTASDYARAYNLVAKNSNGSAFKSTYSKTNSYATWKSYWLSYYVGSGTEVLSREETWVQLWNGTYTTTDKSKGPVHRIYNPYLVRLKLKPLNKKQTDLELVGSPGSTNSNLTKGKCTAEYSKGYLYVKVIGNAVTLENPSAPPNSGVSIEMTSSANHINQLKGTISPQKLEKDKPVDYAEAGSTIIPTSSSIEGSIATQGSYFKIPIKQTDDGQPQKVKIKLFVNPTKSPTEITYDNNPWEKEIEIPATLPDLIAHKITHSYTGGEVGSRATVNLQLITKDKGFENLQQYVASQKDTKVIYKVWIDGSPAKDGTYAHAFLKGTNLENVTFPTPPFTESKLEYKIKVLLHINPDRNLPTKEETFDNNKLEIEFTIKASVPKPPPPPDPDIPKFTKSEDCVFLDKDSPKSDSVILYNMGTYQQVHNISNPKTTKWPINSEIYWSSIKTSIPQGMNWGQMQEGKWEPVYPEYGKNGWITSSSPDETGACPLCKYDNGGKWYKEYNDFITKYTCKATFKYWDTNKFQESRGANKTVVNEGSCFNIRLVSREVSHTKPCYDRPCCNNPASTSSAKIGLENCLHKHHYHSHSYPVGCSSSCDDDCSGGHTETHFFKVCEHAGNSCPSKCHGYSCCGTSYSFVDPVPHYHYHTEYRLEYLSYVVLTFNVKLDDKPVVKVMDYGSGKKITRAGYGISTQIQEVGYATDYKNTEVAPHQYGNYPVKPSASKSIVKTPANNKRPKIAGGDGVYLISRLEQKGEAKPFAKMFINVPNKKAEQKGLNNFKEVYTDVDYPNGDLPVLFQVYYQPFNFQPPRKEEWMTKSEQTLTQLYGNRLKKSLGVCADDKITIKGNIWDDAWTHPTNTLKG